MTFGTDAQLRRQFRAVVCLPNGDRDASDRLGEHYLVLRIREGSAACRWKAEPSGEQAGYRGPGLLHR